MGVADKIMYSMGDLWVVYSINSADNGLVRHPTMFTSKEAAQDSAQKYADTHQLPIKQAIYAIVRASNNEILRGANLEGLDYPY